MYHFVKIIPPFAKQCIQQFSPRYSIVHPILRRNKSDTSCGDSDRNDKTRSTGNRVNFEFHPETEAIFNHHVNVEFKAFYYYLSMASYFGRVDVALPGCESFFTQMHVEEHEHALQCLNYIKIRGGKTHLCSIESPIDQDWKCPLHAFKTALQLEMEVTEHLVSLNAVATKHGDLHASDFVVTNFMEDQMMSINEIGRFITVLSNIGDQPLARFLFDKDLLENHVLAKFNVLKGNTSMHPKKSNPKT